MKHLIFIAGILFFTGKNYGQFAIINDKDGYANVREKGEVNAPVSHKLQNGHMIFCFETEKNWSYIDYSLNQKELSGYVYKDRYKLVSSFDEVLVRSEDNNFVKLLKDSIEIVIVKKKFEKSKHIYKYYDNSKSQIVSIDGKKYWGTDGETPKSEYKSIGIKIGKKS